MASKFNTAKFRSILGAATAALATALPATPAAAVAPSFVSSPGGTTWRDCVAAFRAAELEMKAATVAAKSVEASCKAAYGKIVVPQALRNPFAQAMGWFDMSVEELWADMMVRRQGPDTPSKREKVKKDLEGVPAFKAAQKRAMAPKRAALELFNAKELRFFVATRKLRDFAVADVAELAEKLMIATEVGDDWIMEGAVADAQRLAGGAA